MNILISDHAAHRFIKRHAPEMSFHEAKSYLREKAPEATPLKEKTIKGSPQWLLEDPRCVLVMRNDRRQRLIVCVTVLPEPEGVPLTAEEMAFFRGDLENVREEDIDRVIASSEQTTLITPSLDPQAEMKRVKQEGKLWNRILTERALAYRKQQEAEGKGAQAALRKVQEEKLDIIRVFRELVLGLQRGEAVADLLAEIPPQYLEDAFLRPGELTKKERREVMMRYDQ